MSKLIVEFISTTQSILTDLLAEYYIDTSGSTAGTILKYETDLAKKLELYVKRSKIIAWDSSAVLTTSYPTNSGNGTYPTCFIPYMKNPKCIVIFTDGEISIDEIKNLTKTKI